MRRRFDAPDPTVVASLEATREAVARFIANRESGGPTFVYAVRAPAGELVGGCELRRPARECVHVSYWTFAAFRGRGYATRALALLCEAARSIEGVRRIEAHIDPDNLASLGVARRVGFAEVGETQDASWSGGISTRLVLVRVVGPAPDQLRPMA